MQRLSGTDSLFLAGETRAWHQHVAGLAVVDPTGVPGFGYDAIRKTVEERLPLVPKFMWKLRELPLRIDRPVWVDDPDFDIDRHMFRATVDPPGGPREVAAVVGEILSRQLDRSLPLWQLWYLDGIVNGRAAIVMKYHHCLLDGVAGTGLATSPPAYSTTAPFGDDYGSVTTPYTVQYVDPAPTSTTTYNAGVLLGVNTLGAAAPAVPNAALGTGASPRLPFWVAMTGKRGIMQVLVDNTTTIGHTLLVSTSHIGNYSDSGGATRTYGTHVGIALQAVTVSTGPILCWAYINMP